MLLKYGSNSRYALSTNNKEALPKSNNRAVVYTTYVARDGDSMDRIAHKVLGDFSRYWEIADLNPHIKFPNLLTAGQVLRIPR